MHKLRNKWVKNATSFVGFVLVTFISLYSLNLLTKTTIFQVFGEMVNHVETNKKLVALTYDDGPKPPYTNQLLDLLDRYQIKATFFVVGEMIEKSPKTVRLILSKGHELGNHSYSHQRMIFKKPSFIRSEIEKTDQLLRRLGVRQEIHFRAPYGRKLLVLPYTLARMKKKNILWDVNPKDYEALNAEVIESYVLEHINPGSIVVLHDGGGDRSKTIAATERLIEKLQERGYTFKTVSELIREREQEAGGRE